MFITLINIFENVWNKRKKIIYNTIIQQEMSTILLTLNSNFTDPSDLDKKVKNVFKMFKNHLKNTSSPMSKESDMESL